MGTGWRVRYAAAPDFDPAPLRAAILARLDQIVSEMSQWEPTSHLSRFNGLAAGSWATLPPDFATVIAAALAVADASDGAFDPTHGRAAALLGYSAEPVTRPPTDAELAAARAGAGWTRLTFDPAARRLRQPGGLWLDLSGIAKGFAVDAIAAVVAADGLGDALVEIGGELVGRGLRPELQPWWVELEQPPGADLAPLRVALHGLAVATSGDYRRGAHTLDPANGRPLAEHVASVSVIHDSAMLADAWATALTVLGPAAGMALATRERLAARIVTRKSGGFAERLSPALSAMLAE